MTQDEARLAVAKRAVESVEDGMTAPAFSFGATT